MSEVYINHHLRRWLYSGEFYKVIDAGMGFRKIGFMFQLGGGGLKG